MFQRRCWFALAHLKAEFIRGRERGRGERGYYVSAATVREREGPFYLSRTRIPPGAWYYSPSSPPHRTAPCHVGMPENVDGRLNSRHSEPTDVWKIPIISSISGWQLCANENRSLRNSMAPRSWNRSQRSIRERRLKQTRLWARNAKYPRIEITLVTTLKA